MSNELKQIQQSLAALAKRFDAHDRRFDEHDRRFDEQDKRFDAHDRRFDEHDRRFDEHDRRFDRIEERMERGFSEMGIQFEQLQSTLRLMAEQMSSFNRSYGHLEGRVDTLEEKQRMADLRLKLLETRP